MKEPLVSIITPCYNGERFLNRYFESILSQTYKNLELIFVNDGSTDKTEEMALSYREKLEEKGIKYIYLRQENAGQAAALNRGLKLFTGEYLTWPDSDDVMTSDCIEKKVRFLEENPGYGFCICKTRIVEENNPEKEIGIYERIRPEGEDNFFEDLLYIKNIYFAPGGYMVRSSAILDVIPDREIYTGRGGQNAQMLLPVSYKYSCGYLKDVLYIYFIRKDSHSHSIIESVKIVKQWKLYEMILQETLKKIGEKVQKKYSHKVAVFYAKYVFGNAIDSQDMKEIKEAYLRLKDLECVSLRNKVIYIRQYIRLYLHI